MELREFWRTLLRRWYVVVLVLLLTAGAVWLTTDRVGARYESVGSVLVFPPTQTVVRDGERVVTSNPYLELDGLIQARDIVIRTLTSSSSQDRLAAGFPEATYEVTPDFTNGAPIVLITVEATDEGESQGALTALMEQVPKALEDLQDDLDLVPSAQITSRPLTQDEEPQVVRKDQLRAGIAVAGAALAAGLLLVALVDGLLAARRRRRADGGGDDDTAR